MLISYQSVSYFNKYLGFNLKKTLPILLFLNLFFQGPQSHFAMSEPIGKPAEKKTNFGAEASITDSPLILRFCHSHHNSESDPADLIRVRLGAFIQR